MNAISFQCATVVAFPPPRVQCLVTSEHYSDMSKRILQSVVFAILAVLLTFVLISRHFYFDFNQTSKRYNDTVFLQPLSLSLKSLFLLEERLRTTMLMTFIQHQLRVY